MQSTKRIEGFDIAKTVAIILLFFVHSNLSQTQFFIVQRIQYFFLGIFFYASGYFAVSSIERRGRLGFLKHSSLTLYVPYVAFVIFYLMIGYPRYTNNFLYFVSGLNLYAPLGIESYNLWFIPALLFCYLISAFCFDHLFVLGVGILSVFVFQALNPTFLHWLLPIFLVVYFFGYLHRRIGLRRYLVLVVLLFSLFFVPTYLLSVEGSNIQAMGKETLYTLILVLPFMLLMSRIHVEIPMVRKISESTLYIYLAEPIVTSVLAITIFGTQWGENVGGFSMFSLISLRILVAIMLGTSLLTALRLAEKKLSVFTVKND